MSLIAELRELASTSGIDLLGVTSARPFIVGDEQRVADPCEFLPGAKSIVVAACYTYLGMNEDSPSVPGRPRGRVWYHPLAYRAVRLYSERVIAEHLKAAGYEVTISNSIPFKTAAVRAGIAHWGKNCLVHADGFGSYLELGCVITDAELEAVDEPTDRSDCGECTACIRACPFGAIDRPYHLARESCMTLWLTGAAPIPGELRKLVGTSLLGCGTCRAACPMDHGLVPRKRALVDIEPCDTRPELIPLLLGDEQHYRKTLPGFDVYTNLDAIRRSAALALGNSGDRTVIPALTESLKFESPEVREMVEWAIRKLGG